MFAIRHNIAAGSEYLTQLGATDIPFAIAIALTKTAKEVQAAEISEMGRVFNRPTPFALRGTFLKPATPQRQEARVWLKDDPLGVGTPAAKFLGPQIFGGERGHKRFEKALIHYRIMPADMYAVPGERARLDQYGNLSRGQIVQILSALGAAERVSGYLANRTARSAKRKGKALIDYFVGRPGNGDGPMGIWQRVGEGARPVVIFVKRPVYRPRFRWFEVADRVVADRYLPNLRDAVERQLARRRLRSLRLSA